MGIDLSIIWFVIIVFATLMYIVMDGFDLGIGILFPATPDADDRDVMVNSVAPVWDGNETWLVLGGAALFGAFPLAYAVIIDALTIPLTLMLIGLIFRGVAFEFRFKATPAHRPFWDKAFMCGSILATFALGASPYAADGLTWNAMLLPLIIAVVGVVCSVIGTFLIRTKENATQKSLLATLRKGTYTAAVLAAVIAAPVTYYIMGSWGPYIAILAGLVAGCAIGYFTEYYTSDNYKPTQQLAAASETGSATIIIGGISLGLKSTMASILIVSVAILLSYFCAGGTTTIIDASGAFTAEFNQGLYGIGIAAVGMLSTLGITLATDAYGPVADNAGGIAEMSGLPEEVRDRTDALDSLGNTTAATGKGFAIGSASLTALALLVSYVNIVQTRTPETLNFTLTSPSVLVGLFIGAMLTFVFSALTMSAVQTAAQSIVVEVRRQFREIVGIMDYKADPDYAACVSLCTKGALHEMVAPALLAVVVPIVTGLILGPTGVVGLLGGVSVTGFAMAVFMSNAGGAWDNAKKYIERGNHGGKGSPQHKAAVVGDTVGDPFKDTSGPSLNILIKLCSTVSIVFAGLIIAFNLMNVL